MKSRNTEIRRQTAEEEKQFASSHLRASLIFLSLCSILLVLYGGWKSDRISLDNSSMPDSVADTDITDTEAVAETEVVSDTTVILPETETEKDTAEGNTALQPESADMPVTPLSTGQPETEKSPESEVIISTPTVNTAYDYTKPVPETEAVDYSYFDDAVFFGDSRIQGFCLYSGLNRGTCCAYKGLSTLSVFTEKIFEADDGTKITAMEKLATLDYGKIYIMLGINETGWPSVDTFKTYYSKIIDGIRDQQSEADIYILSVLPVSKAVSDTHPYVKNDKIASFNACLETLTEEKQVYYIDLSALADGEDGTLSDEASADGIHLGRQYCQKWLELLRTHTVLSENGQ